MLRMTAYPTYTPALTLPTPLTLATDALARFPYIPHWRLRAPVLRSIAPRALSLALALATCLFTPQLSGIPSRSALTAQAHPAAALTSVASVTLDAFTRSLAHRATHAAVGAIVSVKRTRRKIVRAVTRAVATFYAAPSGGISQWAYTGHAAYGEPSGGTQGYPWGWCTAGAAQFAHDNVSGLGDAWAWAGNARARGMAVGYVPRAGATVVFAPGVQGAGGLGHVAHVLEVFANGWFLVAEVNFTFAGGGFGRVDYRYAHTGAGVQFIY